MQLRKYFLKFFIVLSLFSIAYSLTSLYIFYYQNVFARPDVFHEAIDSVAPYHISCYYMGATENSISPINDIQTPENPIFFHETNCQWSLHLREACSVESAARAHPNRQIYVIFSRAMSADTDIRTGVLEALATHYIPNIHYHRVDLNTYAQGTPLERVFDPRPTWLGNWHYRKIRELLKFLTLYKFGGIVVDFDMMVVGSLDKLGEDWASREGEGVESGIISLSRGLSGKFYSERFLKALMRQIAYDGVSNADSALTEALTSLCNTTDVLEMNRENCKGFRVYTNGFSNISNTTVKAAEDYLGYHIWNETTGDHTTSIANDSLYATLAKKYCPVVYYGYMATDRYSSYIHL